MVHVISGRIAITVAKLFNQVLFNAFSSERRKWILWQCVNEDTDDFVDELRHHLTNSYSLLGQLIETDRMMVKPTRMDRVLKFKLFVFLF